MKKQFLLEKEIYDKDKILEGIEDFEEVCPMSLWDDFSLQIEWEDDAEIEELFREFMNYVISL